MDLKKFSLYTVAGSLPWTLALGYFGVLLGPHWEQITPYFHILDIVVIIGIILGIIYLVYYLRKQN